MKPGKICTWMDQGPAVLLEEVEILDPISEETLDDYLSNPDLWPREMGWTIRLIETGEILDVHSETLTLSETQSC